jgi:anti-sigma factor RsiW
VSDSSVHAGEHMNALKLSAYLDGRVPAAERERMEAHMAECAECRHQLVANRRLIRAVKRPGRKAMAVGMLIAASVAVLMVTPIVRERDTDGTTALRNAGGTPVMVAYGPIGETAAGKLLRFSWAPAADATIYRFTLAAAGGTPIWNASVNDTTVALPDSVKLRGGTAYVWVVDALLGTGVTRSTGLREFQLSP